MDYSLMFPLVLGFGIGSGIGFLWAERKKRKYRVMLTDHRIQEEKIRDNNIEEFIKLAQENRAKEKAYLDAWWKL